jgi:uncharacterized Fe-S cluster-containing radical SAM superfamily enzyme
MEQQASAGMVLRFLVTDRCNLRCVFCHNEFQGDLSRRPGWDYGRVEQLLSDAGRLGPVRVKFSGGEPLLRWRELVRLLDLACGVEPTDITIFTNLTLLTGQRLHRLSTSGVDQLHVNLPSFDPDTYASRTGRSRRVLDTVIRDSAAARRTGLRVQLNLVLPSLRSAEEVRGCVDAELSIGWTHRDCWDGISFLVDDWSGEPEQVRSWIREALTGLRGAEECARSPYRTYEFRWRDKTLQASRCTTWSSYREKSEADVYVVPPGTTLTTFTRGRAYR